MDKKTQINDNTFDEPTEDIQAQISLLMGLPADEAAPTMSKKDPSNVQTKSKSHAERSADQKEPIMSDKEPQAVDPGPQPSKQENDDSAVIESPETDAAVTDILKKDSDTVLEQEDAKKDSLIIKPKEPNGFKKLLRAWWQNKRLRNATAFIVAVIAIGIFVIPTSRYATLNAMGIRANMSFVVADQISGRPVKNVDVVVANVNSKTGDDGTVELSNVRLGESEITLTKRSFEQISIPVVVGWGSNPFDAPLEIVPTGTTFNFTVLDWLDDEPVTDAVVSDGESEGIVNENGIAKLTIEPTDEDLDITITADNYRQEVVTIPADITAPQDVKMVAATPDVFISKRSGKYDVYTRDLDGKNEELILPATGSEQPGIHVLTKFDDNNKAALVSSRSGERNSAGYILSDLYMIDIGGKTASKVEYTQSERIRLVGWIGDNIIFVKTVAGPSGGFGDRQRVIAYNTEKDEQKELATANYFNDVRLINNQVYYVISSGASGSQTKGLGRINSDGSEQTALITDDVYGVFRSANDELIVSASNNKWYTYNLKTKESNSLEGEPAQLQDIKFSASPDNKQLARIETRDGKSVLLTKNLEGDKEQEVLRQSGISYPLTWVNNKSILFVINTQNETASYVISTKNNKPVKIGDITASIYDQAYFY